MIARLIKLSNLSMDEYLDDEKLLKLVNLGINSDLPFVTHALACLLQDSLDIGKTPTNKEPDALVASTSWNSGVYLYYIAFFFMLLILNIVFLIHRYFA